VFVNQENCQLSLVGAAEREASEPLVSAVVGHFENPTEQIEPVQKRGRRECLGPKGHELAKAAIRLRLCLVVEPRQHGPLFQEESQHFSGCVGAVWIGVSTVWTAAGPGMAASVDEPLLNDHRAGPVPDDRAGMRADCGVPGFRALDGSQKRKRPQETPEAASSLAVTLRGIV
jgi:hypothetical protein